MVRTVRAWLALLLGMTIAATAAGENPLVVAVSVPRSGVLSDFGLQYERALLLWQEQVNAAGGMLGRKIELRIEDDRSDATRAGALYQKFVEDKVDALIGPYGSAATMTAAAFAERARRVFINAAGPSAAVHRRSPRFVFQVTAPYGAYGHGAIELAAMSGLRKVVIFSRDDPVSREMAEAARDAARKRALDPGEVVFYRAGEEEFSAQIAKGRAAGAAAWIAFAEPREAAALVRGFRKLEYAPAFFFARGAAEPQFIELVGQDAEFTLALVEYQASWHNADNAAFAAAYRDKWAANPTFAAAQGHAAATVLGEALRRAGSTDQEKLRATLSSLEIPTVLGGYRIDPANGTQLAAKPAVVQMLNGRLELVWPPALEATKPLPYAPWSERRVLR